MPRSLALSNDLRIAVARLSRRLRRSVADETLGFPHMSALGTMQKCGPITLQELSTKERVTPPSMLRTVQGLVDHGYVDRTPHETDGRKQLLVITDDGQQMIEETRRRRNAWLAARLDALTPDERATLQRAAQIMERIAEADA
ncbi:MarR family winged helix-turn-helix transcriptional regulator [Agrococcus jejuensis]|uniref:MarR family winged helix-turn-helix transcriptional regulator n=1 Tax=Agrococcus jejuensis TaxID=399736 RepID=UPI0011A66ADB|nr:MarR family transcriptional regulator [Agrococcus jejuensis]